jgi:hypothetical protein
LEKAFNHRISVAKPMIDEPIIIKVNDVDPEELKKRIAWALDATWETAADGTWNLLRTPKNEADEQRRTQAHILQLSTKLIESCKKQLLELGSYNIDLAAKQFKEIENLERQPEKNRSDDVYGGAEYVSRMGMMQQMPIGRAMLAILSLMNPKELAKVSPTRKRIVWSNNPTAMQLPLNADVSRIFAQLSTDVQTWKDMSKGRSPLSPPKKTADGEPDINDDHGMRFDTFTGGMFFKPEFSANVKTVQVVAGYPLSRYAVEVKMYDDKGKRISRGDAMTLSVSLSEREKLYSESLGVKSVTLKYSPIVEEFRKVTSYGDDIEKVEVSEELKHQLLNPLQYDITWYTTTENFARKAKDNNMVIAPSSRTGHPREDLAAAYFGEETEQVVENGWYMCRPFSRTISERSRTNHRASQKLVDYLAKFRKLSIERSAEIACMQNQYGYSDFGYAFRRGAYQILGLDREEQGGWNMPDLKLYGLMTQSERELAKRDGGIKISVLNPELRKHIESILLGIENEFINLQFDYEYALKAASSNASEKTIQKQQSELQDQMYGGLLEEPTNMFSNGLNPATYVELREKNRTVVRVNTTFHSSEGSFPYTQELGLEVLAYYLEQANKGDRVQSDQETHDWNNLQVGTQRFIEIRIKPDKWLVRNTALTESEIEPKKYTLETLPPTIKASLDAMVKRRRGGGLKH